MNYEASAFGISVGFCMLPPVVGLLTLNNQIVLAKDWDQVIHMVGRFGAIAPTHIGWV